ACPHRPCRKPTTPSHHLLTAVITYPTGLGRGVGGRVRALTPARDPIAEHWRLRRITLSLLVLVLPGAVGCGRCSGGRRPGSGRPWPAWCGLGSGERRPAGHGRYRRGSSRSVASAASSVNSGPT